MSNNRSIGVEEFAEIFGALSNPNRLRILLHLISCCAPGTRCTGEAELGACVGDLGRHLDIAPSTVSHHLKELYRAGLIKMERQGQKISCWIDPETLKGLTGFFSQASGGRSHEREDASIDAKPGSAEDTENEESER
ncbi:MAG: metalloregulator ArsR/SmtB family transcription factor [Armatimonadetes bacterium]|nr:metalloregulator ArsR/SmtB family transcription factor [Armatimonadota bacterium]NIM24390.1 metalloregulator ArsR/SmtB family transcription factor [Armatimonadota bacterium]NIM68259.1 metalloregulator ArsR/SmtB family transcription factor [Armatimonadota bacterium]NIM75160.1 metalloregulator ArsR/SmtB family transcription factor [Armatimonadota bacterium]NIN06464.1 metalloregulator ArsR/SmtB family transcription factor [Armatimonadota bacterium]